MGRAVCDDALDADADFSTKLRGIEAVKRAVLKPHVALDVPGVDPDVALTGDLMPNRISIASLNHALCPPFPQPGGAGPGALVDNSRRFDCLTFPSQRLPAGHQKNRSACPDSDTPSSGLSCYQSSHFGNDQRWNPRLLLGRKERVQLLLSLSCSKHLEQLTGMSTMRIEFSI